MAEKEDRVIADRRSFLKLAGLGSVAGTTALVGGGTAAQATQAAGSEGALYRETEHVKTFYDTARF